MEIQRQNGIYLPECNLWLDSLKSRSFGVVSHAHSDHAAWHKITLLTPPTAALMRARKSDQNRIVHEIPFYRHYEHDSVRITLLPAGHILGSAQIFVECEEGDILYTGDFKLRKNLTTEQVAPVKADTLVMECTFGLPRYRFPSAEKVKNEIIEFCRQTLDAGEIPVLLAYSIGKAQEIMAILKPAGLRACVHGSIYKMAKVYENFGVSFGEFVKHDGKNHLGSVLIYPPNARADLSENPLLRFAIASGWAMDKGAIYRSRCDAAFPLSDHADYDELIDYVKMVQPKRVLTVHGFVEEFARDLRRIGVEALALGGVNQLELGL